MTISDIAKIQNTISHFANCYDLKDWDSLKRILSEVILCDYRDLRGIIEEQTKEQYVELRKQALENLFTQHLFSNFEIDIKDARAQCRVSAFILRKNDSNIIFNTHAIYSFDLLQLEDRWLISKIKQTVLWNEGDSRIHLGVNK